MTEYSVGDVGDQSFGIGHGHVCVTRGGLPGGDRGGRRRRACADLGSRGVADRARHRDRLGAGRRRSGPSRRCSRWRWWPRPVGVVTCGAGVGDADRVHRLEPGVPIDAAPRVPAAARLLVVDSDGEHVRGAELGVGRQVALEGREPVRTGADLGAVEVHGAVHVDAVELDEDPSAPGSRRAT